MLCKSTHPTLPSPRAGTSILHPAAVERRLFPVLQLRTVADRSRQNYCDNCPPMHAPLTCPWPLPHNLDIPKAHTKLRHLQFLVEDIRQIKLVRDFLLSVLTVPWGNRLDGRQRPLWYTSRWTAKNEAVQEK